MATPALSPAPTRVLIAALLALAAARAPLYAQTPAPVAPPGAAAPSPASSAAAPTGESVATLEALARTHAERLLPPLGEHQRLIVGPLDQRFVPEHCLGPIEPVDNGGAHPRDRVTIELACAQPRWHRYIPVRVVGTSPVLIAAHALVAGAALTEADVRIEQRDLPSLPPGYMDELQPALGLSLARPIPSGAVITNQMLLGRRVVQRGQMVTLVADAGGLAVRMEGRALGDGMVNQRVRVQNLSSGKVVEGVARSDQLVEINLQ